MAFPASACFQLENRHPLRPLGKRLISAGIADELNRVSLTSIRSREYHFLVPGGAVIKLGLMPLFAYALDREIRRVSEKSLMDVFARWATAKDDGGDLLRLIQDETGYDPAPFFERYYSKPVENPRVFLAEK